MIKLAEFIRKERLYILLVIFLALVSASVTSGHDANKEKTGKTKVEAKKTEEGPAVKRQRVENLLQENKGLAIIFTLASLLILLVLTLGLIIDTILFFRRFSGKALNIYTCHLGKPKWGIDEVIRVAILFTFFGYMLVIIESLLVKVIPIVKNNDFRMVLNSSILDTLTIVFILYFTVGQYKVRLKSLGIVFKNFFKNVFYGIAGYIAILPVLFLTLILTSIVTNFIKYIPKEQVVVELFMRESNPAFLIYTGLFAAIAGPIVEELFFRGFMYSAIRKRTGIFPAMIITAAVFAALHAHAVGFLPILILGILLAYLYEKTGTLVSSVTVHVMHNFSMMLLVLLAKAVKGI